MLVQTPGNAVSVFRLSPGKNGIAVPAKDKTKQGKNIKQGKRHLFHLKTGKGLLCSS